MMTPEKYRGPATYYGGLAEKSRDLRSCSQMRRLADNYMTRAKGLETLDRTAKLLKASERNRTE
jgi:hypothetical protein